MLYIASDHGGYHLKKYLVSYMENQLEQKIVDLGPHEFVESDDFPDYAIALSKEVAKERANRGILICKTGHGMCIAANKINGIKAIVGYNIEGTEMGRKHNNANVLCLAAKVLSQDHATAIVKKFLETQFDGDERLVRRNKKIEELEK